MRLTRPQHTSLVGAALVAVCLGSIACGSEPRLATWEPIDVESIQTALDNPTGLLSEAEHEEFLQDVERRVIYLLEVADEVAHLIEVVDELPSDEGTGEAASHKSNGTTVFLAVACPGHDGEPLRDFSNGELRVESPGFRSASDFKTILEGGDLLIDFRSCELPSVRLSGDVPALFVPDLPAMALDFTHVSLALYGDALDVAGEPDILDDDGNARGNLGLPVRGFLVNMDAGWRSAVLVRAVIGTRDRTFSLDLTRSDLTTSVSIQASDGSISCIYRPDSSPRFECDAD